MTRDGVTLDLSRVEVLAIRNLLTGAGYVPMEISGPKEIFERLRSEFDELSDTIHQD
jgi:hypothetical protein